MSKHPYDYMPDYAFWRRAVSSPQPTEVDPVVTFPFTFGSDSKVVTAGSCFAQHISRRLAARGYNYHVTERGHPLMSEAMAARYNYGVFSCRYGNIYTARQLHQLAERAYGRFTPVEEIWEVEGPRFVDPFRPAIQPGGFATRTELHADRTQHLAAVRRALEELDIFVFTLGLTECWASRADGAVLPVCPGVSGGVYSEERYRFLNFGVAEVVADLNSFFSLLFEVNADCRAILTVSPVPLIATAEPRHVLVSNTWSKAVLRVAAELVVAPDPRVAYFPAYEIVTGASDGRYFDRDMRTVTSAGVDHVMRLFFKHATEAGATDDARAPLADFRRLTRRPGREAMVAQIVETICEEEALERDRS